MVRVFNSYANLNLIFVGVPFNVTFKFLKLLLELQKFKINELIIS